MNLGLNDKVALVFGGGSGLGRAIAMQLSQEGAAVIVAGRNIESLEQTVTSIRATGNSAMPLIWDLSELSIIEENLKEIEHNLGPVDILINNTGGPPPTPAAGQEPELWTAHFHQMVLPVISITDQVLPGMRKRGWGRIITSTSSGIIAPIPNLAISNALRLSLVGWSKTLAREVGADGITANIVVPGRVATGRVSFLDEQKAKREGRSVESVVSESCAAIPVGRYGDPREYGDVVAFLASERASYITGSVIRVDGGQIASL